MVETHSVVRAPEFPDGLQWLNTTTPLRLVDLRGKIVLLDFWTSCCINCLHIIPDLTALERKYRQDLVVIGVHAAKFHHERETDNIRQAIVRYDIHHPVVNDRDFRLWHAYAVRAWPTLIVITPKGYVLDALAGEGHHAILEHIIEALLAEARSTGMRREAPLSWTLEKDRQPDRLLSFPGKVLAHGPSQRLFIADSHHHRILIATLDGTVLDVAGNGTIGQRDGNFAEATFHYPQGMALAGDLLYVADTNNHMLRRLDFATRTVTTIAGTGHQAHQVPEAGPGTHVALNSPWDVHLIDKQLFIAMAGSHQIWMLHVETGHLAPYAGSGREDIVDGPRLQAALAQPSGLTSDGIALFVADSETSALRALRLGLDGMVQTLVGKGLFVFGDQDGTGRQQVRLQHPLGLTYDTGCLYVADTYNHKIKKIDLATVTSSTYLGSDKPGLQDGQDAEFYEPGDVSIAAGKLYIADTNNHAIRVADLATAEVTTLPLRRLTSPAAVAGFSPMHFAPDDIITVLVQQVKAGVAGYLHIDLHLPVGYHLNPRAPLHYSAQVHGPGVSIAAQDREQMLLAPPLPLRIPLRTAPGRHKAMVDVEMTFYYCRTDDTGVCAMQSVRWQVVLHISPTGDTRTPSISYTATAPEA